MTNSAPDYLDPHKWAAMLGLIPDSSLQIRDEAERELLFQKYWRNTHIHQVSGPVADSLQRSLWAEFTAKYLPSLVDRLLDLPPHITHPHGVDDLAYPLQNVYHNTLKFTDIAYLSKFMTSSSTTAKGGKRIIKVMTERLVGFAPNWLRGNPADEGCIHRAVTTLMMLVIARKDHGVPERTSTELVHWLDTWEAYKSWSPASMKPDNNLSMACGALSRLFKHSAALKPMIKQRRRALKCIEVCALPTCAVETNLKTCSRCKTVTYCCKAHQQQHWKDAGLGGATHKKRCHETDY